MYTKLISGNTDYVFIEIYVVNIFFKNAKNIKYIYRIFQINMHLYTEIFIRIFQIECLVFIKYYGQTCFPDTDPLKFDIWSRSTCVESGSTIISTIEGRYTLPPRPDDDNDLFVYWNDADYWKMILSTIDNVYIDRPFELLRRK